MQINSYGGKILVNINTNTSFFDRLWNARLMVFNGLSSH